MTPAPKLPSPILCLVTDRKLVGSEDGLVAAIDQAVSGGVNMVQVREKDLSPDALLDLTLKLKAVVRGRALIIVNSDYAVAKEAGVDGVQMPEYMAEQAAAARAVLGDSALIGRSAHIFDGTSDEALFLGTDDLDFLVLGTIFTSRSHPGGKTVGLASLEWLCAHACIPVIGIGGIDATNARRVVEAGAAGVAVISAILGAKDPRAATEAIMEQLVVGRRGRNRFRRRRAAHLDLM